VFQQMEHNRNCVSREPFADLTNTGGIGKWPNSDKQTIFVSLLMKIIQLIAVDVDSKELKEADGVSAFCFSIRRSEKRA
jgi:hypothetical protein